MTTFDERVVYKDGWWDGAIIGWVAGILWGGAAVGFIILGGVR